MTSAFRAVPCFQLAISKNCSARLYCSPGWPPQETAAFDRSRGIKLQQDPGYTLGCVSRSQGRKRSRPLSSAVWRTNVHQNVAAFTPTAVGTHFGWVEVSRVTAALSCEGVMQPLRIAAGLVRKSTPLDWSPDPLRLERACPLSLLLVPTAGTEPTFAKTKRGVCVELFAQNGSATELLPKVVVSINRKTFHKV